MAFMQGRRVRAAGSTGRRPGLAVAVFSGVLLAGGAASAQPEQTQAGAQEFIGKALTQGTVTFERLDRGMPGFNMFEAKVYYCNGSTCNNNFRIEHRHNSPFSVVAVHKGSGKDICYTSIDHYGLDLQPPAEGNNVLSWYNPPVFTSPEILWDKVAEVKVEGRTVLVNGITPELKFNLPSEALAARLGFAMEFLRTSCDSLGSTGF